MKVYTCLLIVALISIFLIAAAPEPAPAFKVLVITSKADDHMRMMTRAKPFLEKIARENNFFIEVTDDSSKINDAYLKKYAVFVQLQLAPFDISKKQQDALQHFAEQGKGWVGIHAAGLTGDQFGQKAGTYWDWFEGFMGGVVYHPHPEFQKGTVIIEDRNHPVTKGLPEKFEISDEWYEFDKSPRPNVRVLARADETTYKPNKAMGDHPIIWTNPNYKKMIYIGIGHDGSLCEDKNFEMLIRNAIVWASGKQ
jgi:type 1 glutamine amidotransferase